MANKGSPEYNELVKEIRKQRKRIQQFVRRAEKRGYSFPENVVPDIPKNPTEKTLERFKKITPETLYKKAIYTSPEGTKIKGTERRKEERSEASKKGAETKRKNFYEQKAKEIAATFPPYNDEYPANYFQREYYGEGTAPTSETDTVLKQIEDLIDNFTPSDFWSPALVILKTHDKNVLKNALNAAIAEEGRDNVAKRCQENASYVVAIAEQVLYGSGNDYKVRGVEGINKDIQRFKTIITGKSPTIMESLELNDLAEADATPYE